MNPYRIRVLLVDDDDSLRLSAEHILVSSGGFDVFTCANGEEAIERLTAGGIDVMVLDQKMPVKTGLNVLQWMHERKLIVPTLMLTGEGSEHIAVEALKMGAYDYIRKDHLELRRLPIVVNGLFERKLFREERTRREQDRIRAEERASIEHSIQEAIGYLGERVTDAYMETFRLAQEAELAAQETTRAETKEDAFRNLRLSLERMVTDIRSLLDQTYLLRPDISLKSMPRQQDETEPELKPSPTRRS